MSLLTSEIKNEILGELKSVGQRVQDSDITLALNRAISYFYQAYDLPTAKRIHDLIIYPSVREYALPSDFASLIHPRSPGGERAAGQFTHERERDLYARVPERGLAVEWDEDTPFLVAMEDGDSKLDIFRCDTTTGVTLSGDGSDLKVDDRAFASGSSSLQFTVTPSAGTTTLTFALPNSLDLTDYEPTLRAFFNLYCPTTNTADITSVAFRLGNDSSNYLQWTVTERFRGQAIKGGWGIIGASFERLALLLAGGGPLTLTDGSVLLLSGTLDQDSVDWAQIVITHGTTGVSGVYRLDSIFASKGKYYELPYYSSKNVRGSDDALKEKVTDLDNDEILMPTKTGEAIVYKALELLAVTALRKGDLANYFRGELAIYESGLKEKYPRQTMPRVASYYRSRP